MDLFWQTQMLYLLRILVAAACGMAIGFERQNRMKWAGVRTHLIVAVASALMTLVSKYGFGDLMGQAGIGLDPSRIAAGVVTGIGFLGAGLILVRKQEVSGITTAAGVWATVGVGMAIGAGMYVLGVAAAVLVLIVQLLLHRHIPFLRETLLEPFAVEFADSQEALDQFYTAFAQAQIELDNLKVRRMESGLLQVKGMARLPAEGTRGDLFRLLHTLPDVHSLEL